MRKFVMEPTDGSLGTRGPISRPVDRDHALLEALRQGEPTAAEQLVATYGGRAYRLAIRITGDRPDAEEAVQDAFWSVVRKIDTFRFDSSVGSWIYRITANAAYQKLRGRAHRRDEISLDEVLPSFHEDGRHAGPMNDWSASIDDPAVQTELRAALDSAIGELPDHYRAVIVLLDVRSEEHTSELQSRLHLVCRLLLEKKKKYTNERNILYVSRKETLDSN